ncbi:hypothetical protein ACX3V1_20395 [Escherichia coli]
MVRRRSISAVSYTHLRAHETSQDLVFSLLLEERGGYEILRCLVGSEMCIRDSFQPTDRRWLSTVCCVT